MSIIKDFEYVVAMGVLGLKAAYTRKKIARKAKTFGAESFEGLMVDFGEHCQGGARGRIQARRAR